jgi:cytochrome P450/NADPH-cytochrome P450 reductase
MDNSVNEETEIQNQDGLAIIPQPPEYLFGLLGNIPDMDPSFPLRGLLRMAKIYGPIYKVRLIKRDLVVVSNYHYAKEAFDQSRFEKVINPVLEQVRDFLGDGLFTAYPEEENWGKAHRILIPAFGPLAIRKMFSKMLDISLQMIRRWDHMGPNHEINCSDDLTRLGRPTLKGPPIALCQGN